MMRRCICIFLLLIMASAGAFAYDPSWLMLARARQLIQEGEAGQAFILLQDAIEQKGSFPEAEAAIASIYLLDGEYRLAELQLKKAYDHRAALAAPEDAYGYLYTLADLYFDQARYFEYESQLLLVLSFDDFTSSSKTKNLREGLIRTLRERGIDKALELYRIESRFPLKAYSGLGMYYYRSGRYERSVIYSAYAVVCVASLLVSELKEIDPQFRFTSLETLVDAAMREPWLVDFLKDAGFYSSLYYLASAWYADGGLEESRGLWTVIVNHRENAGIWAEKAAAQLKKPYVEPILARPK